MIQPLYPVHHTHHITFRHGLRLSWGFAVLTLICTVILMGAVAPRYAAAAQATVRAPSNDNFSGAAVLSFPSTLNVTDIEQATIETDEPDHECRRGGAGKGTYSVWYTFTLNQSGNVTLSTLNSQLSPAQDTIISVYQGASLATLSQVACNDDVSPGQYAAVEGWLAAGSYVVKVSYWPNNPPQPMEANSTLVLNASFVPQVQTPTPSLTPTATPSPTSPVTPSSTPDPSSSTSTPTPFTGFPTSTATPTTQGAGDNLLQNGDFEFDTDGDHLPDGWTGTELAKDNQVCNTNKKIVAYHGACAFRFRNKDGEASQLSQLIAVEGLAKQQTLVFSGAVEVTQPVGKAIILKIRYAEPDAGLKGNGKDKVVLKLETITTGFSRLSQTFTLLGTPTKLEISLIHKAQGTRLIFDALSLDRQP